MVKEFNMDMNVGGEAKPPFYRILMKENYGSGSIFIVTKKVDIVRSSNNGMLDVTGFWTTRVDEDIDSLEDRSICSIIIPIINIGYIENLMYRPRR